MEGPTNRAARKKANSAIPWGEGPVRPSVGYYGPN